MKFAFVIWMMNQFSGNTWAAKNACDKFVNDGGSPVRTMGFIYDETPDYVTIVQSFTDENYHGLVKIARSAIKELKILGEINA